jgi:hypothetical protein
VKVGSLPVASSSSAHSAQLQLMFCGNMRRFSPH